MGCGGSTDAKYGAADASHATVMPIEDSAGPDEGAVLRDRLQRERDEKLNQPRASAGAKKLCSNATSFETGGEWSVRAGTALGLYHSKQGQWSLTVGSEGYEDVVVVDMVEGV